MADNTQLNPGLGGDVIATDDIAGVKYQIVKNAFGAADSVTQVQAVQGSGLPTDLNQFALVTGTLTNVNDDVIVPCLGASEVLCQLGSTSLVGATITIAGSMDGGTVYVGLNFQSGSGGGQGSNMQISSALQYVPCAGMTHIRIRLTVVSSGSATVNARAVAGAGNVSSPVGGSIGSIATAIVPGTAATNLGKAEDATHTTGDTGVMALGVRNDAAAAFTSTDGDYSPLSVDSRGVLRTQSVMTPNITWSGTNHSIVSANSTNATVVKASAGHVYTIVVSNLNAAVRYLKFYNKATAPTVGTDVPIWRIAIPPNSVPVVIPLPNPIPFSAGISYALTTGITDADATAVAASEILVNLGVN